MFSISDWGVPLTEAEAEDLYSRLAIQRSLAPAVEWAATMTDYAGAYINQRGDRSFSSRAVANSTRANFEQCFPMAPPCPYA